MPTEARYNSSGNSAIHKEIGLTSNDEPNMYSQPLQPYLILKMLVLLTLANGTPVIAKDVLGDRLAAPIDRHWKLMDGSPLFGSSKTFRGLFLSLLVTSAGAPLIGISWKIGALTALSAMAGDLISSFLKRRMNLPTGSKATGLDQVPESLLPLLVCRSALSLTLLDIAATVALFFVGEVLLSRLLYLFHLRDQPY
jgi:CDP-2,3-bis-(O-geranylgeranyl)-sn-glycerol synthase